MGDNFGMARALSKFLEVIGWLVIVGAGVLLVARVNGPDFGPAAIIGLGVALAGVLMIVVAQLVRAQVATAENTSRLVFGVEKLIAANSSGPGATRRGPSGSKIIKQMHGHTITRESGGYGIDDQVFANLGQAETYARRNPKA